MVMTRSMAKRVHNSRTWPLPSELTIKVFSMLDMPSLCYAAATCSLFNKCVNIDLTKVVLEVAARMTAENADKDEWIVAKVTHFDRQTKEFDVLDEEPGDDEEGGGQRMYKLPISCIIPFPKRNNLAHITEFSPGRHVLAVYPGRTELYKATVISTPRTSKSEEYVLEFDDDEEDDGSLPQRAVPFHKVVALPEGYRQ